MPRAKKAVRGVVKLRPAEIVRRAVVEGVEGAIGEGAPFAEARRRIVDAVIDELREVLDLEGP